MFLQFWSDPSNINQNLRRYRLFQIGGIDFSTLGKKQNMT